MLKYRVCVFICTRGIFMDNHSYFVYTSVTLDLTDSLYTLNKICAVILFAAL